jgi:hypothetical protein
VFSFFFGNEDSEVRLKNEGADKWELRSPPYGSALLFFGLKAGELGNPAFRPALYRVEEHNGRPLQGTVMHVQMKEDIPSSDTPNNVHQFAS